jgi:hypothetical protein
MAGMVHRSTPTAKDPRPRASGSAGPEPRGNSVDGSGGDAWLLSNPAVREGIDLESAPLAGDWTR